MFSVIQGDRKKMYLVGYVKVNWIHPRQRQRSVWPQINPHIICQFTQCPKKESWLGLIFAWGQVPDCYRCHMRIKWTIVLRWLFMLRHNIYIYRERGGGGGVGGGEGVREQLNLSGKWLFFAISFVCFILTWNLLPKNRKN